MISCKERITKKNKQGAAFTDDGFAMGENLITPEFNLCFIFKILKPACPLLCISGRQKAMFCAIKCLVFN